MIEFWGGITGLVVAILLVPGLFWLLEVLVGLFPVKQVKQLDQNITAVILIPAHNEEQVIKSTLHSLSVQLGDGDHVLVIADNCTDKTAEVAIQCGMAVTERIHDRQRGKGFALAHGVAEIAKRNWAPQVVLVLDADCELLPEALSQLKYVAAESPVQGRYLLIAPEGAGPKQKVSAFAIYIKNHIRLLGLARLGGSVPITGSGFGAPYALFKIAELASGEIVEDMKLGCDWAFLGHFTRYAPDARILSPLPLSDKDADTQRQRWEHGHVSIIRRYMPKLLAEAAKRLRLNYLLTALDMAVPPLTSMVAAYVLMALALLLVSWLHATAVAVYIVFVMMSLVVVNCMAKPRRLTLADLWGVLSYVISKVAIYRKLVRGERSGWVKTKRDSGPR